MAPRTRGSTGGVPEGSVSTDGWSYVGWAPPSSTIDWFVR